jgi:prepilin-type N-terminal cleavage/methylation domain-containing protein
MLFNKRGFTFVEVLLVATLIGILSTVTVTAVNVQRQRDVAQDAIAKENVEKLSEAIEVYKVVKGDYPQVCDNSSTPQCDANDVGNLDGVISKWPDDLCMICDGAGDEFAVYTPSPVFENKYYKYSSNWDEIIEEDNEDDQIAVRECGPNNVTTDINSCAKIDEGSSEDAVLASIEVKLESNSIDIGEITRATAKAKYSDGTSKDVSVDTDTSWESSNPTVARVFKDDIVTVKGRKEGSAEIRATYQGEIGSRTVNVGGQTEPPPTDTYRVSSESTELLAGETTLLSALFNGTDVTQQTQWASTNQSVVSVTTNSQGQVVAMAYSAGTARLTGHYNSYSDSIDFRVTYPTDPDSPVVTAISVRPPYVSLEYGETAQLIAYAIFSDDSFEDYTSLVTWTSTPGNFASVSSTGLVTRISPEPGREDVFATFINARGETIRGRTFIYLK